MSLPETTVTEGSVITVLPPLEVRKVELMHVPGERHSGVFCFSATCRIEANVISDWLPVFAFVVQPDTEAKVLISAPGEAAEWVKVTDCELRGRGSGEG